MLSAVDIDALRARLMRERAALSERVLCVAADLHHRAGPVSADFAEQAVERENEEVLQGIGGVARAEIEAIDGALRRLAAGTYGRCVRCGQDIDPKRLQAWPYADRCASCTETSED